MYIEIEDMGMGTIAKKENEELKEEIGQDWGFGDNKIKHPDGMEWMEIEDWKRAVRTVEKPRREWSQGRREGYVSGRKEWSRVLDTVERSNKMRAEG